MVGTDSGRRLKKADWDPVRSIRNYQRFLRLRGVAVTSRRKQHQLEAKRATLYQESEPSRVQSRQVFSRSEAEAEPIAGRT